MKKQTIWMASSLLVLFGLATGCTQTQTTEADAPTEETAQEPSGGEEEAGEAGTLEIYANGEDFVRQGFTSKDGWQISFDHVYVNLAEVTAYQTDPPYNPEAGDALSPKESVALEEVQAVDLAEGDEAAEPILVGKVEAPAGQYNALSWKMVKAEEGPAAGAVLVMEGTAEKDGRTVDFTLKLDDELAFSCGEFVGDERKGILTAGDTANLEATFHFDHLFGDGEAAPEDEINTGALGFEPLAGLAEGDRLEATSADLQAGLSEEDYQKFLDILPSLGHVGEGHCEETTSS